LPKNKAGCQSIEIPLKPLNLHGKILQIEDEIKENLILSTIKISGSSLGISDSLQWIQNILPDVPSMVDQAKKQITFNYKSSFINSYLIISLSESGSTGEITIQTDNYSVLAIMKVSCSN